ADANGTVLREYVYFNDAPLAQIVGSDIYYYHNSHLGTPESMTDSTQAAVWSASYTPFGKGTVTAGVVENNLRFPGQYYDQETGLHYNYFRYYDPSTGRYITSDPLGVLGLIDVFGSDLLPQDINLYNYTGNNPVNFIDPVGLFRNPFDIYDDALQDAQNSTFPGPHNGPQDAYRHCLASCENARENGQAIAQCLGFANEKKGDFERGQEEGERAMDDHNNAIGFAFGSSAQSFQGCRNMCSVAVNNGTTINNYQPGSTPNYRTY
ncbi:Rhs family protein, partial [hydrothermal vent metagenome]